MKQIYTYIILSTILLLASCQVKDPEPVDERNAFTGYYEVDEFSEFLQSSTFYSIDIVKDPNLSQVIYIQNFYNVDIEVAAELIGGNKIRIPEQTISFFRIEGSGSLNGNVLTMSYYVKDTTSSEDFPAELLNAICTKK